MQPGEEDCVREAGVGDVLAEGARDAFDEAALAQAAQVVGHLPRGYGFGGQAEELGQDGPQVAVGEAAGKEPEDAQGCQQGVSAGIAQAQGCDTGAGGGGEGLADLGERGVADGGIVAYVLRRRADAGWR